MAIVKNPALSMDASGNLGGICYSKYRGVNVARDTWTGTYPGTSKQLAQNALMTTVSQAWGSAGSTVDREAWEIYARTVQLKNRLGSLYIPTGFGIYMKLNLQRAKWGLSILNEPLLELEPKDPGTIFMHRYYTPDRWIVNLGTGVWVSHAGEGTQYFKAGPFDSPGRKPIEGEWRHLQTRIPPEYGYSYDAIAGKWYWMRARQIWLSGWVGNFFNIQKQA